MDVWKLYAGIIVVNVHTVLCKHIIRTIII